MVSYRVADLRDHDEIKALMIKHFYTSEPLNFGWINNDTVPEDIEHSLEALNESASYVAIDDDKKLIVGACLTAVDGPQSAQEMLDESKRTKNQKWSEYLRIYARIDKDANILKKFKADKSFFIHTLVVHSDYRGRSIATALVKECHKLAKTLGFKITSISC